MKTALIFTILMAGVSLILLGIVFCCTRAAKPKKWWERPMVGQDDTPEPEKKPDSKRVFL